MAGKRGDYGSNMIRITIRFWTNEIGTSDKKVAWESGVAYLNANNYRSIKPQMERFWQLKDMPEAVKTVLKKEGIKLKANPDKYLNF